MFRGPGCHQTPTNLCGFGALARADLTDLQRINFLDSDCPRILHVSIPSCQQVTLKLFRHLVQASPSCSASTLRSPQVRLYTSSALRVSSKSLLQSLGHRVQVARTFSTSSFYVPISRVCFTLPLLLSSRSLSRSSDIDCTLPGFAAHPLLIRRLPRHPSHQHCQFPKCQH